MKARSHLNITFVCADCNHTFTRKVFPDKSVDVEDFNPHVYDNQECPYCESINTTTKSYRIIVNNDPNTKGKMKSKRKRK